MDDDELMRELAEAGEARSIEEQIADLVAKVDHLSKRLAAKEREPKLKVWDWLGASEDQRYDWVREVSAWYEKLRELEPLLAHHLMPHTCWSKHHELLWVMCQLYQQWQKAFTHTQVDDDGNEHEVKQDDADMGGWWFTQWTTRYRTLMVTLKRPCNEECNPGPSRASNRHHVALDQAGIAPGPVPSADSRDDGRSLEGWTLEGPTMTL